MKPGRLIFGSLILLPVAAAVWCWGLKVRSTSSERASAEEHASVESETPQFHQPVGWAFGRMIGVPQPSCISPQFPVPPPEIGQSSSRK